MKKNLDEAIAPLENQREKAFQEVKSQFADFNPNDQSGVTALLRRMRMKDFGPIMLTDAINEIGTEIHENEYWTGKPDATDNRVECLSVLSTKGNGLVGRTLSVDEVTSILESR